MNRSTMLKVMHKINKIYITLNKYIYILPLISMFTELSTIRDNKIFKLINKLIKLLILISIVISGFVVLYFTDFTTPLTNTYSLYSDLLEPYYRNYKNYMG